MYSEHYHRFAGLYLSDVLILDGSHATGLGNILGLAHIDVIEAIHTLQEFEYPEIVNVFRKKVAYEQIDGFIIGHAGLHGVNVVPLVCPISRDSGHLWWTKIQPATGKCKESVFMVSGFLYGTPKSGSLVIFTVGINGIPKPAAMRLLLYNIRYAVGGGASMHVPLPGAGYLLGNQSVLPDITEFIRSCDPDIVGLIEVDTGSIRSRMVNQAESIGAELGMNSSYEIKYGESSINQLLPIIRKQGNAFLAAERVHGETFHYFDTGIKRLIIELEMKDFCVFLVHLSLKYRHRHLQLRRLYDLIIDTRKPVIVAGDFNAFWGENEIYLFMKAAGLQSANTQGLPSYPSRSPRKELDFILYQEGIQMRNFEIPAVRYSDHLPLICDFDVDEFK